MFLKINTRLKLTEEEKIRVELSYLKSQINPHFLFNTLNSIYALAIKENANKTATGMLKLSGMMRYVVTEASNELVSLEKEMTYINNYIELQKLRLDKSVMLNFEINGDIQNQKIAPIILIPFIENAFKYGVNPDEDSNIKIVISISKLQIILLVENNKVTANSNTIEKTGYGIKNTKNRLALLYPARYELDINETATFYTVKLKISLT
jgi:LytS/YehU family sensor histidine kinase